MKEIPFDKLRADASQQSQEQRSKAYALFSSVAQRIQQGNNEDLDLVIERATDALDKFITIGYMVEYLMAQEEATSKDIEDLQRQIDERLEERQTLIFLQLEKSGMDLSAYREAEEPEVIQQAEKDDEKEKRKGIDQIREKMGDLEAFKTGDPEIDRRLEAPLESLFGVGGGMRAGFCRKFNLDHFPTIGEFLSSDPQKVIVAPNWGPKRFENVLERIYEAGVVPSDEKGDLRNEGNEEAQKEAEFERIKESLGKPDKFKTKDDPEGARLDIPLGQLGFTRGLVLDIFGRSPEIEALGWRNYMVRGLLSKTYAELTKRGSGIGHVKGRRILEILHANGYIP